MTFTGGTMLVGLIQLALFYWQLRLMRATVKDAGVAATAAALSAKAAVGIELPILRFVPIELASTGALIGDNEPYGATVSDRAPERFTALGGFKVTNNGRTPAFCTTFSLGWQVAERLTGEPVYLRTVRLNHAIVIQPNQEQYLDVHQGVELSITDVEATERNEAWLWVYGCICYRDFMDEARESRFCWRYADRNHEGPFYFFASDGEPPPAFTRRI